MYSKAIKIIQSCNFFKSENAEFFYGREGKLDIFTSSSWKVFRFISSYGMHE